MQIFENTYDFDINNLGFFDFDLSESVFFDIETTGFSAKHTNLYLIGCIYYNEKDSIFKTRQWFLDNKEDEIQAIEEFFAFIRPFKNIVHFNGEGFDIPYLKEKCRIYQIENKLDALFSFDLYKCAFKLRKILKLENLKQKTIEKFLGLERKDEYSGKELIDVYDSYKKSRDKSLLNLLLLHNLDDIKGLLNLSVITNYKEFFDGGFNIYSISIENNEVIIELMLKCNLPTRISGSVKDFYLTAYKSVAKIKADIYRDELKFFYQNYKDYYYLPEEDRSIHKSVAFYVDKNYRTQAKAATCYSKKTGNFLLQFEEIITPYFKIEYDHKETYFELTDDFLQNATDIYRYTAHILKNII